MKDSALAYKISDKKFLKQNELAEALGRLWRFVKNNRNLVIAFLSVIILLALGVFGLKLYRVYRIESLSEAFFAAKTSLKKEALYRDILARYGDLPASQMARLNLAQYFVENQKTPEALKILQEGLKSTDKTIFSTLVVLKSIDLLKAEKKYGEAATFAAENEKVVMDDFLPRFKLIQANLLLLAGQNLASQNLASQNLASQNLASQKDKAKLMYQNLSTMLPTEVDGKNSKDFDPAVVDEAKDQLLLLELGIL